MSREKINYYYYYYYQKKSQFTFNYEIIANRIKIKNMVLIGRGSD